MKIKILGKNIFGDLSFKGYSKRDSSLHSEGQLKTKNYQLKTTSSKPLSFYKLSLGFTLVELIVVITILAILGTIAFVSFGSYSSSSRDSARVADINSLNKSLELFQLKASKYPDPSGNITTVTYSGGVVFKQGSLGDSVVKSIGSISKKPIDPLNQKEYTYSINSTSTTFQIKADFENKVSFSPFENILNENTFADSTGSVCYIKGNYNSLLEKTSTGGNSYILALPGLITDDISSSLDYNTLSGKILCNGINTPCNITFTPTVVYSGASLPTTTTQVNQMMIKLQEAYSGSNSASIIPQIKELLSASGGALTDLGSNILKNNVGVVINNTQPVIKIGSDCNNPGLSCKDILDKGGNVGNGEYCINSSGTLTGSLKVYCDMTTDGGGWTLIAIGSKIDNSMSAINATLANYKGVTNYDGSQDFSVGVQTFSGFLNYFSGGTFQAAVSGQDSDGKIGWEVGEFNANDFDTSRILTFKGFSSCASKILNTQKTFSIQNGNKISKRGEGGNKCHEIDNTVFNMYGGIAGSRFYHYYHTNDGLYLNNTQSYSNSFVYIR